MVLWRLMIQMLRMVLVSTLNFAFVDLRSLLVLSFPIVEPKSNEHRL